MSDELLRSDNGVLIARAESDLARQLEWVRAAESRISLVLPVSTAMLGALAVFSGGIPTWSVTNASVFIAAGILLSASLLFSALSAFPRTQGPDESIVYFGRVSAMSSTEYIEKFLGQTDDERVFDVLAQCHRNAEIATAKYCWARRSLIMMFISALPWALSLFLSYASP